MINLKKIPAEPGVYIYRNSAGEIIYVGKAINLKKRVSQYWERDDALGPKTQTLVSQIASIETKIVGSEIEALILESSLIKQHQPKYNSSLKDDKNYIYICITRETVPRIFSSNFSKIPIGSDIYGPFPDSSAVRSILKSIRRIFPYRSREKHPKIKCLYCHLGLCPGPNPDKKTYRHNILKIKKILSGNFRLLQRQLKKEMNQFSQELNYEAALRSKNQLDAINYIVSGWHDLNNLFEKIELPTDEHSRAKNELKTVLKISRLSRIESYDISNLGANYFVGSMSVWQNDQLSQSEYRKFKIRSKFTPDDQYMIREIVFRRLKHLEWPLPDLIIVDGGKPQISSVTSITSIPVIGLAKKFETIIIKTPQQWVEINLPLNSSALHLLQQLRNEAHRFANQYRRQLISKQLK